MLGRRRRRGSISELRPRELDVLAVMAEGKSTASRTPGITVAAVEKRISRIFSKLEIDHVESEHRRVHALLTFLREN